MALQVLGEIVRIWKFIIAELTRKRLLSGMNFFMSFTMKLARKCLWAEATCIFLVIRMCIDMHHQVDGVGEDFRTNVALIRQFLRVFDHVPCQS